MDKEEKDLQQIESVEQLQEHEQEATVEGTKKSGLFKRIFSITGTIAFALLLIIMGTLVFSMVQGRLAGGPPSLLGYQMYIVQGGSMSPAFEAGSLALLQPIETENIQVGDIITYQSPEKEASLTTHRVVDINQEGGQRSFTTRGDANLVDDQHPVSSEHVVGEVKRTVPYAGYLMNFGQTKTGIIFLVFIPGALIIAFEIRNLFHYAAQWEEEKKKEKEKKALSQQAQDDTTQSPELPQNTGLLECQGKEGS